MPATEVLVRHAMALADPDRAPSRWELGPAARAAAADLALRARLGEVVGVASSTEPKARATAEAFARRVDLPVVGDERLVEARRPWVGEGYRSAAHRYLAGDEPSGWEPRAEVAARTADAIDDLRAASGDGELVVVGHGLALSLHLEAVLRGRFDAYGFWCRLAFPDAWRLDRTDLTLSRVLDPADR
ncbi:histidine phosphatase family protein [Iamia majanohamensis]|uniref:Histidine phosphatase family protein n=1 Tax=Iamia majanohamensis TaxID=467976 RepID=A0AAE9Y8L2_9ACTN|nr:histidine phosphatase family protein [Iamia majanohamensis]WCO68592.1 histidine phosphatase family protein [Iamia majanohamensis]